MGERRSDGSNGSGRCEPPIPGEAIRWHIIGSSGSSSGMTKRELIEAELTASVIGAFFEVYNHLRSGLPEHVYVLALERELREREHRVAREVSVPVLYKGTDLTTLRLDMLVDERLIVEAKSTDVLHPSAMRQLHGYLGATPYEVGLLLHFGPEAKFYRIVRLNANKWV
jgi:GxxExxY protein